VRADGWLDVRLHPGKKKKGLPGPSRGDLVLGPTKPSGKEGRQLQGVRPIQGEPPAKERINGKGGGSTVEKVEMPGRREEMPKDKHP